MRGDGGSGSGSGGTWGKDREPPPANRAQSRSGSAPWTSRGELQSTRRRAGKQARGSGAGGAGGAGGTCRRRTCGSRRPGTRQAQRRPRQEPRGPRSAAPSARTRAHATVRGTRSSPRRARAGGGGAAARCPETQNASQKVSACGRRQAGAVAPTRLRPPDGRVPARRAATPRGGTGTCARARRAQPPPGLPRGEHCRARRGMRPALPGLPRDEAGTTRAGAARAPRRTARPPARERRPRLN